MNKIVLWMAAMFFTAAGANGQTTEEEYKYLAEGYEMQLKGGLDMKKGYRFVNLTADTIKGRVSSFKALFRDDEDTPCGFLLVYTKLSSGDISYVAIPLPDSDDKLWQKTYKTLYKGFYSDAINSMLIGTMNLTGYFAGKVDVEEYEKK